MKKIKPTKQLWYAWVKCCCIHTPEAKAYHKAMFSVSEAGSCSPKPDIASHGALWMEEGGPFTGKDKVQELDSGHMIYCRLVRCRSLSFIWILAYSHFLSFVHISIYRYIFKV